MNTTVILLAVCLTAGLIGAAAAQTAAPNAAASDGGYVYSSFTGDGEDGLHLLTSPDGKTWKTVWGPMSEPAFAGPGVQPDNTNAEGPSVVRAGGEWFVYCDYWQAHRNGLFTTKDFKTLTRISDEFKAPQWVRHGTAFKVPKSDYDKLESLK